VGRELRCDAKYIHGASNFLTVAWTLTSWSYFWVIIGWLCRFWWAKVSGSVYGLCVRKTNRERQRVWWFETQAQGLLLILIWKTINTIMFFFFFFTDATHKIKSFKGKLRNHIFVLMQEQRRIQINLDFM